MGGLSPDGQASQRVMHCLGNDSRCQGRGERACLQLDHCYWEPVEPEATGKCDGNDSRCQGAWRSRCETLSLETDCRWACKPWCESNANGWDSKCAWKNCLGCSQCDSTSRTTSTTT